MRHDFHQIWFEETLQFSTNMQDVFVIVDTTEMSIS